MMSKTPQNSLDSSIFQRLLEQAKADQRVLAVIVFGSFVRGEKHRDVDVCVVLVPGLQDANVWEILPERPADIDLSIFSDLPLYVRSRVVKEGEILLNKDYNLLFDIYRQTIKDFVLFEPHYKMFLEAVKSGWRSRALQNCPTEEYLQELGQFMPPTKKDFIKSRLIQRAVERVLQLAIECVIDTGFMLVKEFNLGPPRDEDNIFQLLEGRVSHVEKLQAMKRFRNILVHKYGEVDPKKVYQVMADDKQDFYDFIADVKKLLQNTGKPLSST